MSYRLDKACHANNKAKVLQLLRSPAVVDRINDRIGDGDSHHSDDEDDVEDDDGYTALGRASKSASADVVEALMRKGASVNVWSGRDDYRKWLPIHAACRSDIDAVKKCEFLLGETNSNINEPSRFAWERLPISIASFKGNIELVTLLLRRGADCDIQWLNRGPGPLQAAARNGHVNVIELLLQHDPRIINIQSQYVLFGRTVGTALHAAVWEGQVAAVKALVSHPNCDVTLTDSEGRTALKIATVLAQKDIITIFTEADEYRKSKHTNPNTSSASSTEKAAAGKRKPKPKQCMDEYSCAKAELEFEITAMRHELGNISLKSDKRNDAISQKLQEMDKRFDVLENKLHSTELKVKDLHEIKTEQKRISDEIRKLQDKTTPVSRPKGASNELSDLTLDKIAVKVGIGDQMSLGLHLGFEYEDVERAIAKYASQKDATLNLLIRWRNQESSGETKQQIQQLKTIFRKLNKMNLVRSLEDCDK